MHLNEDNTIIKKNELIPTDKKSNNIIDTLIPPYPEKPPPIKLPEKPPPPPEVPAVPSPPEVPAVPSPPEKPSDNLNLFSENPPENATGMLNDDGYYWIEWPIASDKWYYRVPDETVWNFFENKQ